MNQNIYDDPGFFARYSAMERSIHGLDAAGEWEAFRVLLPELRDKPVLDLGCGFGWHCRYARQQQARSVVGVDLSEKMLARAGEMTNNPGIEYRREAIEDIRFATEEFDVAISSLALHYVEHFDRACQQVYRCLCTGGAFVFSVEHPVFTALEAQDWYRGPNGQRLHWPVDNYYEEGIRHTTWMAEGVVKYHRTVSTYVNTVLDAGFVITRVVEPVPPAEMVAAQPDFKDEFRRPMFLPIAAVKAATR
jgi:SAM-dependent methyltransferase